MDVEGLEPFLRRQFSGNLEEQRLSDLPDVIRDIDFQTKPLSDARDLLGYEKDILNDWARLNLSKLKGG